MSIRSLVPLLAMFVLVAIVAVYVWAMLYQPDRPVPGTASGADPAARNTPGLADRTRPAIDGALR